MGCKKESIKYIREMDKFYDNDKSLGYMCPYKDYYRTAHYDCCEDQIEFICANQNLKTYNMVINDWHDICKKCSCWKE